MKLKTLKNEVLQNAPFINTLFTIEIGNAVAFIWYLRGFEVMFNHRHMENSVFVLKISFKIWGKEISDSKHLTIPSLRDKSVDFSQKKDMLFIISSCFLS